MRRSFIDVINLWPSDADFARDIHVRPNHLQTMKARKSIPAEYWPALVSAARRRRIPGITLACLASLRTTFFVILIPQMTESTMMTKQPKLGLGEMKALLPPAPVLANESQEQFEKFFDQVLTTLQIHDMVEMILVRDFVLPSWEIARYTRHRVVALDRKFKGELQQQVSHLRDNQTRRAALAQRLVVYLGLRPREVSQLIELGGQVLADVEIAEILKHAPSELPYNRALQGNIDFHKDLEFLITSMTKRRDQALEMLDRYRQGLGRRAKEAVADVLDAEYNVVETKAIENQAVANQTVENQAVENQTTENRTGPNEDQIAPLLTPPAESDTNREADEPTLVNASAAEDGDDGGDA
jgi:hypothetical protein